MTRAQVELPSDSSISAHWAAVRPATPPLLEDASELPAATTDVRKLQWGETRPAERYNLFVTHSSSAVAIKHRNISTLLKDVPP